MVCKEDEDAEAAAVHETSSLSRGNIRSRHVPGYPTDMRPRITEVRCLAEGTSVVTEGVWYYRYRYVDEIRRMGAHIQVDGKIAVIEGVDHLTGVKVKATDLRAGAAMVIAGLIAKGETVVEKIQYVDRGYENIVEKLTQLGADIKRVQVQADSSVAHAG